MRSTQCERPGTNAVALVWAGAAGSSTPWESVDYAARYSGGVAYSWDLGEDVRIPLERILGDMEISLRELSGEGAVPGGLPTPPLDGGQVVFFSLAQARRVEILLSDPAYRLVPSGADLRRLLVAGELESLYDLTRTLRSECPWDREQTQDDIVSYTLEEVYELIDVIRSPGEVLHEEVEDELGDLLFQVYFLARVAEEEGWYDLAGVAAGIRGKLMKRHPHIFGEGLAETPDEVRKTWDEIKRYSEGREGIFAHVPDVLPALLFARKLQQRAAVVGFDWDYIRDVIAKVQEEVGELFEELGRGEAGGSLTEKRSGVDDRVADEIGDVLFAVVNVARKTGVDPELALRMSAQRFRARIEKAARLAAEDGVAFSGLDLEAQEVYYQRAKDRLTRER